MSLITIMRKNKHPKKHHKRSRIVSFSMEKNYLFIHYSTTDIFRNVFCDVYLPAFFTYFYIFVGAM